MITLICKLLTAKLSTSTESCKWINALINWFLQGIFKNNFRLCDGHLDLGKVLRQIDHLQSYLHLSFQRIFRFSFNYFRQVSKMLGTWFKAIASISG